MSTKPRALARRAAQVLAASAIAASGILVVASPASANTIIAATVVPTRGPGGGGNVVVLTGTGSAMIAASHNTAGTDVFVQFQRKSAAGSICAVAYQPPGEGVVNVPSGGITVSDPNDTLTFEVPAGVTVSSGSNTTDYNICVYDSTTNANALTEAWAGTAAGTPYRVVTPLTLNPQSGPTAGGNSLTLTAPTGSTVFSSTVSIQFRVEDTTDTPEGYCSPTWLAQTNPLSGLTATSGVVSVPQNTVGVISPNKVVINPVPAGIGNSLAPSFHVCVYGGTPSGAYTALDGTLNLIAGETAMYTVGVPATISTVSPAAGPAQGGNTITVTGTNFHATLTTATLGGVSIPVTYVSPTSFTSVLPARVASGPHKLTVTTPAGSVQSRAGVYMYSNGISATPNTAPNTSLTKTWVSVVGNGFANMAFAGTTGSSPNNTGGHVYLVKGAYDSRTAGGAVAGTKTNGQTTECVNVLVVQDTELVCELYLAGNQTVNTRTVTGCSAVASAATTIAGPAGSTTCLFLPEDVGKTITASVAGVVANTTITAVAANGLSATISKATSTSIIATTPTFTISSARTITADTILTSADTVGATAATGPFTAADVGKLVTVSAGNAVLPANTYVTAVSANGTATLSNLPTTGAASANSTLTLYSPVPVGVYTVTVVSNGAANAATTDVNYVQSIISSGSTFTVSDY
jgi:hypothetical protein